MTKKNFKKGIDSLLGDTPLENEAKAHPEPKKRKEIIKTIQEGTYEGEIRATFIVNEEKLEILKALAYWERKKIKNLLDEALDILIKSRNKETLNQAMKEFKNKNI